MPTQFSVWHSEYTERCLHEVAKNNSSRNPVQLNMLLRTGEYESAEEQEQMDPQAFSQCSQAAFCTLKVVPEAIAQGPGYFNIWQGATEAYLDFITGYKEQYKNRYL